MDYLDRLETNVGVAIVGVIVGSGIAMNMTPVNFSIAWLLLTVTYFVAVIRSRKIKRLHGKRREEFIETFHKFMMEKEQELTDGYEFYDKYTFDTVEEKLKHLGLELWNRTGGK